MPPPAETCKTCKYWTLINNKPGDVYGYCRRDAPIRRERPIKPINEFVPPPTTKEADWCGEYVKV